MIRSWRDEHIDPNETWDMLKVEFPEPRRARRIRDKQRMKAYARWIAKRVWFLGNWMPEDERNDLIKRNEKIAEHLAHCNKPCCNKRRRYEGPTIQELRQLAAAQRPLDREFAEVLYDNLWDMYVRS